MSAKIKCCLILTKSLLNKKHEDCAKMLNFDATCKHVRIKEGVEIGTQNHEGT